MFRKITLLGIFLSIYLSTFALSGAALARDPGGPGPLAVTQSTYDDGDSAFTPGGFPQAVEVRGSVHYPTGLPGGPYPLVVFLHGRHVTCFNGTSASLAWPCPAGSAAIPSFEGYDYIAEVLASHGYVVVSISANGINALDNSVPDLGMAARAELVQHHLEKWRSFNTTGGAPFGPLFVGKIDLNRIGTMGHSRGGEGVVRHFLHNASLGSPFSIEAVLPIAPTDFSRFVVNEVDLGVLLPYCDGDVSDLQGVHFYDDARYNFPGDDAFKHTFLVMGANHNFFNTVWTPGLFPAGTSDDGLAVGDPYCSGGAGSGRLSVAEQQGVGLAYTSAFFRRYLGGEIDFMPILTDGPPPPSALGATIHPSLHSPDTPTLRKDINRLLTPANLTSNTLGGAVSQSGLVTYRLCGGQAPQPAECLPAEPENRQPHTTPAFLALAKRGLSQLEAEWNGPASFTNELPAGERNVSGFSRLQFRVGVNFASASNPAGVFQSFSVTLEDGDGTTATVDAGSFSDALFFPPGSSSSAAVPKLFLNTIRIPTAAFVGVDLTDVKSIELSFDATPAGSVMLTDLAFTNVARPVDAYFLVDLSGSFADDLPLFKSQAPGIVASLQAFSPDVRFGLGYFVDYPIDPFGDSGDKAYGRMLDFTTDGTALLSSINGLTTFSGNDVPESQLVALYQAATGLGQDLSPQGFPAASIPAGQQASFRDGVTKLFLLWTDAPFHRPGDPGSIPYPGPSFNQTVEAILALDPPKVVGISSGGGGLADLEDMAAATGALASKDLDCNGDGTVDIAKGAPLVCTISSTGAGISDAIVSLVSSGTSVERFGVSIDVKPGEGDPPTLDPATERTVTVAIYTTARADGDVVDFDAALLDPASLVFGPGGARYVPRRDIFQDLDGDGDIDAVVDFHLREAGLIPGQPAVVLRGMTTDGTMIEGVDAVSVLEPSRR